MAYATADSPFGPFKREAKILQQDSAVVTGAGHHAVIYNAANDKYYIIYHRRPLGETDANHRVTCIEETQFDKEGKIIPVKLSNTGVTAQKISS